MHRSGGEFNQNYLGSPSQTIQVVYLISCPEDSRMGTVAGEVSVSVPDGKDFEGRNGVLFLCDCHRARGLTHTGQGSRWNE